MKSNCPPKIVLEGFFYDGRFPEDAEDHVASCAACQEKIRLWTEERGVFLQKYPFQRLWESVEERKKRFHFWEILFPVPFRTALALTTLAGIVVFVVWQDRQPPDLLTKGGVGLGFYVAHQGEIQKGHDRINLAPGDDLQFVYSVDRERFLLLFGLESDGTFTVYFPHGGSRSAQVETGKNQRLPQAIRWQPRSPYERFYAIFSGEPIPLAEVQTAVKSLPNKSIEETARLPLPYPQASVIVYRKNGK
jgi:hypothetical protein